MNMPVSEGMTRREFSHLLAGAGLLSMIEPGIVARELNPSRKKLSYRAYQNPSAEGTWNLTRIEGKVPRELNGTLYRVAPGQKVNHGVVLKHLFDGDAFLSGYSFQAGKVTLKAKFLDLPERLEELQAGRMLYTEFGTLAPGEQQRQKSKNQPSVNIIYWDNMLLGLSEGGHPTSIDPVDLSFRARHDFYGTLPGSVPFTAHPKFDPVTGEGYGFGVQQGMGTALKVYRMGLDGKLVELYSLPQNGYYMVHDMLLSREHIIFVIPPVRFDLPTLFKGQFTPADALRYFEKEPTRLLILRRDSKGKPVTIEQPPNMVFHHGNAFEKDGKIVIDTFLSPDESSLIALYSWSKEKLPPVTSTRLTRIVLDPEKALAVSRTEISEHQEFPRFDTRRTGLEARYLYSLESSIKDDPFATTAVVKHDLTANKQRKVKAGKGRMFGEAVFIPRPGSREEDGGWIVMQGYDGVKNENFVEILDAGTMDFETRIWTGQHFPLGFHGNFSKESLILSE